MKSNNFKMDENISVLHRENSRLKNEISRLRATLLEINTSVSRVTSEMSSRSSKSPNLASQPNSKLLWNNDKKIDSKNSKSQTKPGNQSEKDVSYLKNKENYIEKSAKYYECTCILGKKFTSVKSAELAKKSIEKCKALAESNRKFDSNTIKNQNAPLQNLQKPPYKDPNSQNRNKNSESYLESSDSFPSSGRFPDSSNIFPQNSDFISQSSDRSKIFPQSTARSSQCTTNQQISPQEISSLSSSSKKIISYINPEHKNQDKPLLKSEFTVSKLRPNLEDYNQSSRGRPLMESFESYYQSEEDNLSKYGKCELSYIDYRKDHEIGSRRRERKMQEQIEGLKKENFILKLKIKKFCENNSNDKKNKKVQAVSARGRSYSRSTNRKSSANRSCISAISLRRKPCKLCTALLHKGLPTSFCRKHAKKSRVLANQS